MSLAPAPSYGEDCMVETNITRQDFEGEQCLYLVLTREISLTLHPTPQTTPALAS